MNTDRQIREYHLNEGDRKGSLRVFESDSYLEHHGPKAFKAHRHSYYQLIWFKTAGYHFIDYQTFRHPENALFFVDKGQVHYFCTQSENKGYLFHFNDSFLNRFEFNNENWSHYRLFHELSSPYLELSGELLNKIEQLKELLIEELNNHAFNADKQAYFLFRLILLNLERIKRNQNRSLIETKGEFNEIARFHELAGQNLTKSLPINYYSSEMGMSSKKLTNLVSKHLGNTPANIINEKKAVEAKRLLSNSNLSIKEIGYQLGFNQATYFTKFFKKLTDYTPKEFRKLIEKGAFTSE